MLNLLSMYFADGEYSESSQDEAHGGLEFQSFGIKNPYSARLLHPKLRRIHQTLRAASGRELKRRGVCTRGMREM